MSTTVSRRISTGVGWGAFAVLAWATVTLLTSGTSAHADESPDGLLGDLTSLVGDTVDGGADLVADVVTETVAPVVETATPIVTQTVPAVVEPVVQTVASVPVVGDVVQPVTDAATELVPVATTPVTDLLQNSPVSSLTDPVLGIVSDVPVIGDVLDELSVTDAVRGVAGAVDDTTALLGDTVDSAVPPTLEAISPTRPTAPDDTPPAETPISTPAPDSPALALPDAAALSSPASAAHVPAVMLDDRVLDALRDAESAVAASTNATGAPDAPVRSAHAPLGSPAPSSSAGHGGGSVSDSARLRDAAADPLRAWKRSLTATDDDLPSSPVADTDASPD